MLQYTRILTNKRQRLPFSTSLVGKVFAQQHFLPTEVLETLEKCATALPFNQWSTLLNIKGSETEEGAPLNKTETHTLKSYELCNYVKDNILNARAFADRGFILKLARECVTFIRVDEGGGCYDWHRDLDELHFEKPRKWLEMSLFYCIHGCTVGGTLSVKSIVGTPRNYEEATTRNACLLIDKNLEHAAQFVEKGSQLIMKIDVLVSTTDVQNDEKQYIDSNIFLDPPDRELPGIILDYSEDFWQIQRRNGVMRMYPTFQISNLDGIVLIVDCNGIYCIDKDGYTKMYRGDFYGCYHRILFVKDGPNSHELPKTKSIKEFVHKCLLKKLWSGEPMSGFPYEDDDFEFMFGDKANATYEFCDGAVPIPPGTPVEHIIGLTQLYRAPKPTCNVDFEVREGCPRYPQELFVDFACGILYNK